MGILICADRRWPESARVERLKGARTVLIPQVLSGLILPALRLVEPLPIMVRFGHRPGAERGSADARAVYVRLRRLTI